MKKTQDAPVDEKRAINVAEAMLNAARDEAEELSERLELELKNPELVSLVRSYFRQGYVRGVMSVIQKEIYDRLAEEVSGQKKAKAAHDRRLKVGTPGSSKPRKMKKA